MKKQIVLQIWNIVQMRKNILKENEHKNSSNEIVQMKKK